MSQGFDAIIARSRAPGRFVERRSFTLSRDKAVEKLREFSLRHPEQYILELVQAAVFAGARWIAIDVSADRLFFGWVGGRPYTSGELAQVFDYLFADRAAAETRHIVQLAVALNALLQRKPKVLRIESGDGTSQGTVRMDVDKQGKGQLGRPEQSFQGTYLVVEYATNWLSRFSGQDWTREQALVEQRCQYSPVPLLLNYRAPFGYRADREIKLYGVTNQQSFTDDEGRRGVLALPPKIVKDQGVRLVIGGVWITTHRIPLLGEIRRAGLEPLPVVGVVADDRLRKTADQADIVEDARWIDMLHAVQPHATELIRRYLHGQAYEPPPLPRRVAEPAADARNHRPGGPTPEPLPDEIPQVAPRPALELEQLRQIGDRAPVFWTDPDTAAALGAAGGPERFPFCLLVLSPGQALTLGAQVADLSLAPLTSAADAEFVSRVFDRQSRQRVVAVPLGIADGLGGAGTLELRLHLQGQVPAWNGAVESEVPATVRSADGATWCGGVSLGLPSVSVRVELKRGEWDAEDGAAALSWLIRQHAWRLLEGLQPVRRAQDLGRAERGLLLALLAMQCRPRSIRDDAGTALTISLPRRWGETGAAFLRTPLVDTERGPLCLDDLVDMLGRPHDDDRALAVLERPEDLRQLEPLMLRLGVGHLLLPRRRGRPLLAVADKGIGSHSQWIRWQPGVASIGPPPRALLWVGEDLRPAMAARNWTLLDHPAPGVGFALRSDTPTPADGIDLDAGLAALADHLGPVVREDRWPSLLPDSVSHARARRIGRLALIALAARARDTAARVLPASDGSAWRALADLVPEGRGATDVGRGSSAGGAASVRVALRGGPRVAEHDTVLLTWDELQELIRAGLPAPLRFDDPPDVWHSLAEAEPTAAHAEWLLRERLAIPGIDGWLGLRMPYDPTSAVLLQDSGELIALTDVDRHLPCHGLVWPAGAHSQLSVEQLDLLELARLRLYQRLTAHLDGRLPVPAEAADPAAWRQVAERYAIDMAVYSWRSSEVRAVGGTGGRLLDVIRVPLADGSTMGLGAWLELEPARRPDPRGHLARYRDVQRPAADPRLHGDYEAHLRRLEHRLGRALSQVSVDSDLGASLHVEERGPTDPPVRTWEEATGAGVVAVRLNEHHPLVYAALAEAGDAREILLIEAARVVARALREASGGEDLDLLQLHQALATQRLQGGVSP